MLHPARSSDKPSSHGCTAFLRKRRSIGTELNPAIRVGRLSFHALRPGAHSKHLAGLTLFGAPICFNSQVWRTFDPLQRPRDRKTRRRICDALHDQSGHVRRGYRCDRASSAGTRRGGQVVRDQDTGPSRVHRSRDSCCWSAPAWAAQWCDG